MHNFNIELTDAEYKALAHVALNPQEWIDNVVHERCRAAIDEIFKKEVERMLQDPNIKEIPADRTEVVLAANIKSAVEINEEMLQKLNPSDMVVPPID